MKNLGIFTNSTAVQTAIDTDKLYNPYVVLTGASGSRVLDYNTLTKTPSEPITLGSFEHPVEAYEDRYTYYYKSSYTLSGNYQSASSDYAVGPINGCWNTYTLNKTTNTLYDLCGYNGTGSSNDWYRAGLYMASEIENEDYSRQNDFIYFSENNTYYSILVSNGGSNDGYDSDGDFPTISIDPVVHQ